MSTNSVFDNLASARLDMGQKAQIKLSQAVVQGLRYGLHISHKAPLATQRKVWLGILSRALAEPLQDGDLDCLNHSWL
jgi:hypothetical protein